MYLDLGLTGSAWCLSGPLKRPGSTFSAAVSVYISREHGRLRMGDSEPPDILYETCACVIHLQLHVHTPRSIFLSLLNTSEDSLRHSVQTETTSYWVPEDQGTGVMMSQCMKLVLVSFTLIYSAARALIVAIVIFNLRGVYVLREALVT